MARFINSPDTVIVDALTGLGLAHSSRVRVDVDHRVVLRARPAEGKVGLVSGGGAGHEPFQSGFVGRGMLDAAAVGQVFTSPTPDQVRAAILQADGGAGVLLVVTNYTGDVLNFDMGAELALAERPGLRLETVVVADDVAVEETGRTAGRRGVGATLMLDKIAGAAAEEGADLDAVAAVARQVAGRARSMGVAMRPGTSLVSGRPSFDLPEGQMEVGVGIHGEKGTRREPARSAEEVARGVVGQLIDDIEGVAAAEGRVDWWEHGVLAMLSGLGGTPLLELYVLYAEVARLLEAAGVRVRRKLVGEYVTSMDMAGATLTLLPADDELVRLWDAPVDAPALRWG